MKVKTLVKIKIGDDIYQEGEVVEIDKKTAKPFLKKNFIREIPGGDTAKTDDKETLLKLDSETHSKL